MLLARVLGERGYYSFNFLSPAMEMIAVANSAEPMLAHMVYFSLKDNAPSAVQQLVAACHKYLSGHPGVVFYAAGTVNNELTREVNVRDFDVALHVVFANRAAHDQYQVAERHQQFIAENKPNWARVRVFDSDVTG